MARLAALAAAALAGLLLTDCAGGSFGQAGFSLPAADGVQTVSDAADALVAHRTTASQSARAAIAVTDGLGSFVREISADQRSLAQRAGHAVPARSLRDYMVERNGKRILSTSELVQRGGRTYCQSGAGYLAGGIPSLDETFGWQSGAYTGGQRSDSRGSAVWSANASGAVLQGSIGSLSIARNGGASCPMNAPAFIVKGGTSANAFTMPISMEFRRGQLVNLSVVNGRFASGDALEVTTRADRQSIQVRGMIVNGRAQVATFGTNASGDGTLTITSSGAQYAIGDWIVVGI
jgi:hypothetical protein